MLSKSILKYIQSLHHKKSRDEHGVFIAETPRVVAELLNSGEFPCKMICATEPYFTGDQLLLPCVSATDQMIVTPVELEKISLLHTPHKVLAVFGKKEIKSIDVQKRLTLMLDNIQDPGNMGTMIRIADWFACGNIICSNDCVEQYNPKVVQASMGSLARVNVVYTSLDDFIAGYKHIDVYAATLQGTSIYALAGISEGLLLIGNESTGIKPGLLKYAKQQITIPRFGGAESLNAAVAAGIILSHFYKGAAIHGQ